VGFVEKYGLKINLLNGLKTVFIRGIHKPCGHMGDPRRDLYQISILLNKTY